MKRFFTLFAAASLAVFLGCGNEGDQDTTGGGTENGAETVGVENEEVDTGAANRETPADATPEVDEEPATTLPDSK